MLLGNKQHENLAIYADLVIMPPIYWYCVVIMFPNGAIFFIRPGKRPKGERNEKNGLLCARERLRLSDQ